MFIELSSCHHVLPLNIADTWRGALPAPSAPLLLARPWRPGLAPSWPGVLSKPFLREGFEPCYHVIVISWKIIVHR